MSVAYVAPLDGLRAVSIGLVVFSHFGFQAVVPGLLGVTVFFFVSGYLIAGQLLQEVDRAGTLGLGNFYIRRLLRLYPALLVMVAVASIGYPWLGGTISLGDLVAATAYGANFWEQAGGFTPGLAGVPHPLGILWSLSVEEHYYLAFPLLTLLLARRRGLFLLVTALLIVAVGLWRVELVALCQRGALDCARLRVEHGTDTRVDSILFGAGFAIALNSRWRGGVLRVVCAPGMVLGAAALLVASLLIRDPWFRDTLRFDAQGFGLLVCVGGLLFAGWLRPVRAAMAAPWLLLIGRWSYSLYLWHWMVLSAALATLPQAWLDPLSDPHLPPGWWIGSVLPALLAASLLCAAASYYGVERPMVRLRRRFGSAAVADRR